MRDIWDICIPLGFGVPVHLRWLAPALSVLVCGSGRDLAWHVLGTAGLLVLGGA